MKEPAPFSTEFERLEKLSFDTIEYNSHLINHSCVVVLLRLAQVCTKVLRFFELEEVVVICLPVSVK